MGEETGLAQTGQSVSHGLPQWAEAVMRIDPYQLPLRFDTGLANGPSYAIDRRGAVIKTRLNCGLAVSMALPTRAFRGIAARAAVTPNGAYRVTLELHHCDPQLCIPLLVSEDLDDIAADWHSWSRLMKLPMLIIDAGQNATSVRAMLGEIMVDKPQVRRKRRDIAKRRPRFLRKRKTGKVSKVVRISGEELIARR